MSPATSPLPNPTAGDGLCPVNGNNLIILTPGSSLSLANDQRSGFITPLCLLTLIVYLTAFVELGCSQREVTIDHIYQSQAEVAELIQKSVMTAATIDLNAARQALAVSQWLYPTQITGSAFHKREEVIMPMALINGEPVVPQEIPKEPLTITVSRSERTLDRLSFLEFRWFNEDPPRLKASVAVTETTRQFSVTRTVDIDEPCETLPTSYSFTYPESEMISHIYGLIHPSVLEDAPKEIQKAVRQAMVELDSQAQPLTGEGTNIWWYEFDPDAGEWSRVDDQKEVAVNKEILRLLNEGIIDLNAPPPAPQFDTRPHSDAP